MPKFNVWGWLNGDDYDNGKLCSVHRVIEAEDSSEAEDKGDEIFKTEIGTCDVVDAQEVPAKGDKYGECNRTTCNNPDARWFNSSTRKYYCQSCALKIMSYPENKGLLTLSE